MPGLVELLEFVGLRQRANDVASSLPYGDRRRLEIARALGTNPSCCSSTSRPPAPTRRKSSNWCDLIRKVNTDLGVSVLLIEHDMRPGHVPGRADNRAQFRQGHRRRAPRPRSRRTRR